MAKYRMLLVDSDVAWTSRVLAELRARGHHVTASRTRAAAIDNILLADGYDFVVVAAQLSDGAGHDVARTAALMLPTPRVFVAGAVTPSEAFDLGQHGVQRLLPTAPTSSMLVEEMARAEAERPPPVYALLARYVGHVSLLAFEREVRRSMMLHALARAGNRTAAARLLRTSRQLVQKAVNED